MCKFKCLWRTQMTFWAAADWPIKMSSNHASMPETRPDASDSNILWNQSCQRIWLESHNGFGPNVYYYVDGNNFYFLCQKIASKVNIYYTSPIVQKCQGLDFNIFYLRIIQKINALLLRWMTKLQLFYERRN